MVGRSFPSTVAVQARADAGNKSVDFFHLGASHASLSLVGPFAHRSAACFGTSRSVSLSACPTRPSDEPCTARETSKTERHSVSLSRTQLETHWRPRRARHSANRRRRATLVTHHLLRRPPCRQSLPPCARQTARWELPSRQARQARLQMQALSTATRVGGPPLRRSGVDSRAGPGPTPGSMGAMREACGAAPPTISPVRPAWPSASTRARTQLPPRVWNPVIT